MWLDEPIPVQLSTISCQPWAKLSIYIVEIRKLARASRTMEKEIVLQEDQHEQYEIISENDAAYFNSYENLEVFLNLSHIYFV